MNLELFRTLWGDDRRWDMPLTEARKAGFVGLEGRIPQTQAQARECATILQQEGAPYIAIAMTGGGVIPQQKATVQDHLDDLRHAIDRALFMTPRFMNILGGNDRWPANQQVEFMALAQDICRAANITCCFETHRSRILATPWVTLDVIAQLPDVLFTADISHWVVCCERLLNDSADDFSTFIRRVHHIQARIGYDQGPQAPHPAAPEYAPALRFHQHIWQAIWQSQHLRGYTTTMTPECGPDGYLHTLPFTNMPVADLWSLNVWTGQTEYEHFQHVMSDSGNKKELG
ncbi:xylose isomerase [Acetobacter ascendens]|uniref:Xylose isomerase n=1 Tax=Acetobacter ascendens TaxID=481146 RepID=A0A1D8QVS3_9PROT|nr:TIM barrel protein [Acetobacter ascendens]AOW46423.1 xylose isomerase [Acetobacter ascendens]